MKLSTNLIYEAALDDELFEKLPSILAGTVGARSCVLHWRSEIGAPEIFSHSGYFPDAEMLNYATNFATHDVWTDAGMRQGFANRAWRTTDLVAANDYERSIFYNEWIRAMGDDTFYCCGSVMQTVHGQGIIGLHRGKTQADFSSGELGKLERHVDHLRRMFAIRGRIAGVTQRRDLLEAIFASGREAALVLNGDGRVLTANAAGDALLRAGRFVRIRNGQVQAAVEGDWQAYERALAAASDVREPRASDCLLRSKDGGAVVISLMPVSAPRPRSRPTVLLTIAERRKALPRELVGRRLQSLYGLSAAETDIALRLADGQTAKQIGDARRSATGTVRVQVKHVLLKMDAKRQADIVRTVVGIFHQP
ncbi:MAG TPA: LuxR C-terminal-related transcriptional regulator [Sphingomicrobium sp.]|nr:LuxR C-terminal-related transcriptional regulator [Sphingomicrobium sp.]